MAIVTYIILFGLTFQRPLAYFAGSNLGMHFSVTCPWLEDNLNCYMLLSTPEESAHVIANQTQIGRPEIEITLKRFVMYTEPLVFDVNDAITASDFYPCVKVTSSAVIRISVFVFTMQFFTMFDNMDSIRLIPKPSCHKSYVVSVPGGSLYFIAVSSFDDPRTVVTVEFPDDMKSNFREECQASEKCAVGKTVTFELSPYQSWFLRTKGKENSLTGTKISSDVPIYVMAGTFKCMIINDGSTDACISTMKPTVTWGKTYIVPAIIPLRAFHINALKNPLEVTFHEHGSPPKIRSIEPGVIEIYGETPNVLAVTANDPFGLYQLFPSIKSNKKDEQDIDASMLNLIPIEQWMHGSKFNHLSPAFGFIHNFVIVTQANKQDIIVEADNKAIVWEESTVTVGDKVFSVGKLPDGGINTDIRITDPSGTLIVYVYWYSASPESSFFGSLPWDFHQGEIYNHSCKKSRSIVPGDGIDNDCDGFVDEEEKNEKDDDGDGLVDEDYVLPYSKSHWGEWINMCNIRCEGERLPVRIRACSKTFYGEFCPGESLQCDKTSCPVSCEDSKECYCGGGCLTCQDGNPFHCESCRPGYMSTVHCTTPCPKGWGGMGCQELLAVQDESGDTKTNSFTIHPIYFVIIFISISCLLCCVGKRKKPQKKKGDVQDKETEDLGTDPTVKLPQIATDGQGNDQLYSNNENVGTSVLLGVPEQDRAWGQTGGSYFSRDSVPNKDSVLLHTYAPKMSTVDPMRNTAQYRYTLRNTLRGAATAHLDDPINDEDEV